MRKDIQIHFYKHEGTVQCAYDRFGFFCWNGNLFFAFCQKQTKSTCNTFGIAGGVLPDLLQFFYYTFKKFPWNVFQKIHNFFHNPNHMKESPCGGHSPNSSRRVYLSGSILFYDNDFKSFFNSSPSIFLNWPGFKVSSSIFITRVRFKLSIAIANASHVCGLVFFAFGKSDGECMIAEIFCFAPLSRKVSFEIHSALHHFELVFFLSVFVFAPHILCRDRLLD